MTARSILLGVNIDHSATVRQARYREHPADRGGMVEPDPVAVALVAERAGADAITMHLREDRRHIQESDVQRMREMIQTPLNLEMAVTDWMRDFALKVCPEVVLLVPENRQEVSTEGGLDVCGNHSRVGDLIKAMRGAGIHTSLFIDPDPAQIDCAAELQANYVELHTGAFANAYYHEAARERELQRLIDGAVRAHEAGLIVNAGHGINYVNIRRILEMPWLHELNIGHSIISRAIFTGIGEAVREMKALMRGRAGA